MTLEDLFNLGRAAVEPIGPHPLTDNKRDRRHRPQTSSGRPTASTSSMVIRLRCSSWSRVTRERGDRFYGRAAQIREILEGIAEVKVELLGLLGSLKIPEDGKEALIGRGIREMFELLQ